MPTCRNAEAHVFKSRSQNCSIGLAVGEGDVAPFDCRSMVQAQFSWSIHDLHGRVADLPQSSRRRQGMVEIPDGVLNPARSLDNPQTSGGQSAHPHSADPLVDRHQGHRDDDPHCRRHARSPSDGDVSTGLGRSFRDLPVKMSHLGHPVLLATVSHHFSCAEDGIRDVSRELASQSEDLVGGIQTRSRPDDE